MIRRTFVRTAVLGGLGAIFVPKYERWFRPLAPKPPVGPVTFLGMSLTPDWPLDTRPGDLAVLMVTARKGGAPVGVPPGWTMAETGRHGAVFHKVVDRTREPIRLANAGRAQVAVFRNALPEVRVAAPLPDFALAASPVALVGHPTATWGL